MSKSVFYVLANSCAERFALKLNPALNQKVSVYNLMEILRLPLLYYVPTPPATESDFDQICFNNLLTTFKIHWKFKHITAEDMAAAGFYLLNPDDTVRCLYCEVEIDDWEHKKDPVLEHRLASPSCVAMNENGGFDVCGSVIPDIPRASLRNDMTAQHIKIFLDSMAVDKNGLNFCGNKQMTAIEARFNSFYLLKKPMNQDIQTFCESGFVYIGSGEDDNMVCYCCQQCLKGWEPDDDPWVEHALWSPSCKYLLLMKGKKFVQEVNARHNRNLENNVPDFVLNDDSNVENNATDNDEERNVNNSGVSENNSDHTGEINGQHERSAVIDGQNEHSGVIDGQDEHSGIIDGQHERSAVIDGQNEHSGEIDGQDEHFGIIDGQHEHSVVSDDQPENVDKSLMYDICGTGLDPPPNPSDLPKEQHSESNALLCKICLKEKLETMFIPCGHVISCIQCAVTFDECPICRLPTEKTMCVFPYLVEDSVKYPNLLECLSVQQDEKPTDPMICKICRKEEMTIAFLPCRHICACFQCATEMTECPVCVDPFFAILQVFL